jgi:hypothetical protein
MHFITLVNTYQPIVFVLDVPSISNTGGITLYQMTYQIVSEESLSLHR